jgi:aminocarboxymuconate-semialdehyde decarboxylase
MQGFVDVHHHILPPAYLAALGERIGVQGLIGKTPDWNPSISLEAMDRNGISTAITSISSPGIWFGNVTETRTLARKCNEYAATLKRDHPGRVGLLAVVPLPDIEASLAEITFALDTLGADGVGLLTNYNGRYPGDVHFAPVFDELNRRRTNVFFHPTASEGWNSLPEIPLPTLEFPFDTTRAIVNMLFEGTFLRCRDTNFIFSHAGGAVPFLAERVARLAVLPKFQSHVPHGVRSELKRLFFDLALSANTLAFSTLIQVADTQRVLFGSDYPHAGEATMTATVNGLTEIGSVHSDIRNLVAENGWRLISRGI